MCCAIRMKRQLLPKLQSLKQREYPEWKHSGYFAFKHNDQQRLANPLEIGGFQLRDGDPAPDDGFRHRLSVFGNGIDTG